MKATSSQHSTRSQHRHSPRAAGIQLQRVAGLNALSWCVLLALGMSPIAVLAAPAASPASPAAAIDPGVVEFSNAFTGSSQSVDVSRFERGNPVLPGNYSVDIFVNEGRIGRKDISFHAVEGSQVAQPCFDYTTLVQMGVDTGALDPTVVNPQSTCVSIGDISPDARASMDVGELRLDLSIPQESLKRQARGYVSPELWDQGETAFMVGYNLNAYSLNQSYSGTRNNSYGSAVTENGAPVQVQGGQYYAPGPGGTYTPTPSGEYMLTTAGQYVQVQRGTFTPAKNGGYSSNDINAYLGLNLGLNVAGWRIRSQENVQWDQRTGRKHWSNVNTTASHDIDLWKAQFTLGDSYTQGIVFDTTPFRGMTVYSDDRMLPDSQQGYAPVVRGTANTQARVEVRQNGTLLYQTTVAPGPFVISDLYATGYGGDLTVVVFEADGTVHSFAVPYASVPMLLRPGVSRWSITNGQVRNSALQNSKPYFVEGTYQLGINNWLTLYGGVQSTYRNLYHAYLGGAAINTAIGAFALDVTNSHTTFKGAESLSGYSYRAAYSKAFPTSGTSLAVASYRYSNGNYLSLSDAVLAQDQLTSLGSTGQNALNFMRSKQRLSLTLSQDFGGSGGSLYFNGARNTYWAGSFNSTTYQLGYNNTYKRMTFGITASRTYSAGPMYNGSRYDNQFGINLSIPLGGPSSRNIPDLRFSANHDDAMGNGGRVDVSGVFGENSQYNYTGNATYANYVNANSETTVGGSLGWQAPVANINGSYSYSSHYQQASVSAAGGLVVHPGGVTLSPSLSINSPIGIIEAPGAKGARVSSSGQATVDGRGYAVATNLLPYRMNNVTLDPVGTSTDIELQTTRLQAAPRAGAVIPLKFETIKGRTLMVRATQSNGQPLPFGADVLDANANSVGVVGQGGTLFVRVTDESGSLLVRWGDEASKQCHLQYAVPARAPGEKADAFTTLDAACH